MVFFLLLPNLALNFAILTDGVARFLNLQLSQLLSRDQESNPHQWNSRDLLKDALLTELHGRDQIAKWFNWCPELTWNGHQGRLLSHAP